jgi:hypothetical protein
MQIRLRINEQSINDTHRIFTLKTNLAFGMQRMFVQQRFKMIHQRQKAGTMVATGQTRSKAFNRTRALSSHLVHFECGYEPTDNNQSFHQEFSKGPVHHTKKEHYTDSKEPKCSRNPVDIYSLMGGYAAPNRTARRRALAVAIESALSTPAGQVAINAGPTISYRPDLSSLINNLRAITRAATRSV